MNTPSMALPTPAGGALSLSETPLPLSRRAKAAIVVRFLLNEGAEIALEDLPEDLQEILTHQMGTMRLVDKHTVATVMEEFTSELDAIGLSFPGGMAGALEALDGRISPHTANRLRREAGVKQSGDPWLRLRNMPIEKIAAILETESAEISAVVLSKLDVPKAAELLGLLPGPRARQITYAVSQTSGVTTEAVDRIGLSLASQLDAEPVAVFDTGPVERVGAILNSSTSATRDDVMSGLEETDVSFANEVRKAIFTFANIPTRVSPRDLPNVLRSVEPKMLNKAVAFAQSSGLENVADYILENMSARLADQMREEIEEMPKVKPVEGEEAMSAIVTSIRTLEANGELILVSDDETDLDV